MKIRDKRLAIILFVVYVLFALAPLLFMLVGERPMGREFLREVAVAFGFVGIGLVALHYVLTARIIPLNAPFGSDVVYYFHHRVALVTAALWVAHPALLIIQFGGNFGLLNPITASWRNRWGIIAVVVILVLIVLALLRRQFRIDYVAWRIWHGLTSFLALLAVMVHVYMVGRYVGTPLKQVLWLAYGAISLGLVGYLRVYRPIQMIRRPYRIIEVRRERGDTWSLALEPVGHAGIRFQAGQFAWITARRRPFVSHEHPFSFSSSSLRHDRIEFAIRELGDFTATVKDLPVGGTVYVDGPHGSFSPDRHPEVDQYVLVAGGVGIAPIMSILRTMADRDDPHPVTLLYGSYSWEGTSFREELDDLEKRMSLRVVHTLDVPPEGWEGEVGYVTREMLRRYLPAGDPTFRVYICGPEGMLNAVERALLQLDVPESDIYLERFDLV